MSATSYCYVDALSYRARRSGMSDWASGAKNGVKKKVSRAARAKGKHLLRRELQDLVEIPTHDAVLDGQDLLRVSYSATELEAMADRLLANSEQDAAQATESEDEDRPMALPVELLGGLPDWLLGPMEAANGDAFAYQSLLEEKRPRSLVGMLAEDLAEAA